MGTLSMKEITDRYHGIVDYQVENNKFTVSALLNMTTPPINK